MLKSFTTYSTNIEMVFLKACTIFDLNDGLNEIRLHSLFELDINDNNEETLIDFYIRIKDKAPPIVIQGIYIFSKAISQHEIIYQYFENKSNANAILLEILILIK